MTGPRKGAGKPRGGSGKRRPPNPPASRVPGRPFSPGHDTRRNLKGQKKRPKRTPNQILMDTLLTPQRVKRNGKWRSMTKLEVVLEQQLGPAMQGDQKAVRALTNMMQATTRYMVAGEMAGDKDKSQVHNVKKLNSLLEDYAQKYAEARRLDEEKRKLLGGDGDEQ